MISLKRAQYAIQSLIGLMLSEATILKYVIQLHQALARWEQSAIARLLTLPAMHVDETSLRVDKRNHWIHVCSGGRYHLEVRAPQTRTGRDIVGRMADDRHRHHPALWRGAHP